MTWTEASRRLVGLLGAACLMASASHAAEPAGPHMRSPATNGNAGWNRTVTPLPPVTVPDPGRPTVSGGALEGGGRAASEGPRTLADLQEIARQYNPTLVQARMAVRRAQGEQIQAGLCPNPEVGYGGGDVGLEGTSGQQGGFVAQEFVTAGKLRLAQSAAGHGVAAAQQGLEAQRWRVRNAVRTRFYEVLVAQKMVEVNEDLVRVGRQSENITARLHQALEVSKPEVLQASIEAERAEVGLFVARNRYKTAWYQLAAVLGRPEMAPTRLSGDLLEDLPKVTWDDGLMRLLSASPELAQARAAVQQARCEVALQCAERHSNFAVEAGVKYDATALNTLADVGLAMPIKIFDRNQGNIVSAQAELIAASREVDRLELDLFSRFAEAFESYSNANRRLALFRMKVLASAKESLELVEAGYREGEFDYLTLLTAQRTYFAANLEYLDALSELWERSVELDGLMLTGGLEGVE